MAFLKFRIAASKAAYHARLHDMRLKKRAIDNKYKESDAALARAMRNAIAGELHEIPETIEVTTEYIRDVQRRLYFNDVYAGFYMRLADEYNLPNVYNTGVAVRDCHKRWFGDWYALRRVFDRKSLSLCHSKFCSNCNHLLQASRLKRFAPIIEELRQTHDLFHLTLTVPNVSGEKLCDCLDAFYAASKKIFRYFSGNHTVRGFNFAQFGYVGAMRCLEIVTNPTDFHPHFHCLLALKKGLSLEKIVTNTFSFSHGRAVRQFSEFEILLQKILYLAYNGKKVTAEAVASVPLGYSCTLDKVEDDSWHEVFKYVTKLTKDGSMESLSYEQFVYLFFALRRRRVMQGYGCFFNISEDDSIDDEVSDLYMRIIAELRMYEVPTTMCAELDTIAEDVDKGHMRVISRYIIQQLLNKKAKENE